MNIARYLGDAVVSPPERHSLRWRVASIIPSAVAAAEFAMAVATLFRNTDLAQAERLLIVAKLLDKSVSATHVDPAVTLAILAISHIEGNRIMALLETLLKPLLNAQLEAGIEIGRAEGEASGWAEGEAQGRVEGEASGRAEAMAQFEAWKASQRAAGVQFVDETPPEDPTTLNC